MTYKSGKKAQDIFPMGPVMIIRRKECITWAHFVQKIDPTGINLPPTKRGG